MFVLRTNALACTSNARNCASVDTVLELPWSTFCRNKRVLQVNPGLTKGYHSSHI
jgi:hypothetical protein